MLHFSENCEIVRVIFLLPKPKTNMSLHVSAMCVAWMYAQFVIYI